MNGELKICYEVQGEDGFPIVLLHGLYGSSLDWIVHEVPEQLFTHKIILIDLRGHGQSSKPLDPSAYSPKTQSSDIKAVLDHLNISEAIIWGFSYGGRIAFAFAIYYPKYVKQLIVGSMHPYPIEYIKPVLESRKRMIQNGLHHYFNKLPTSVSSRIHPKLKENFFKNNQGALICIYANLLNWEGFKDDLHWLNLANFPILLYVGADDQTYVEIIKQFHKEYSRTKLLIFPKLDHMGVQQHDSTIIFNVKPFFIG
ncbi:MAG: alpha/beta fold hydrolase [Candidatus Kariarchaeaceae archaeon]